MKYIIIFVQILLLFNAYGKLGKKWMLDCRNLCLDTENSPNSENVVSLSENLIGLSHYASYTANEMELIEKMVSTVTSAPNYATILGEEIERNRKTMIHPDSPPFLRGGGYDRDRMWYFNQVFPFLREPPTVLLLGHYLFDERDQPLTDEQKKMRRNFGRNPNSSTPDHSRSLGCGNSEEIVEPNCVHAMRAFQKIGIRDADFSDLKKCRAWWEEVEAGKTAFSFKGQKVEYRFKPDGTWETIAMVNPPNDLPPWKQAVQDREDMKKREAAAQAAKAAEINRYGWWLSVPLMLGIMGWLRFKADTK